MSINKRMDEEDVVRIYCGILLSHEKNEIMPLQQHGWTQRWSYWAKEVRQRRRNIVWHPLYAESKEKWYKGTDLQNRETHGLRGRTYDCWQGRMGKGIIREPGMDRYTLLYLKQITNKDLLYSTWNSAQCYVAAWMGGEFGGEWIHVYAWPSPWVAHQKLSQHCQSAIL